MRATILQVDNEHGQSLVELAAMMLILLVLLAGAVDFGRIFFTYLSMRDAAQEGASYGVVAGVLVKETTITPSSFCSEIITRAEQAMDSVGVTPTVTVTVNGVNCPEGTEMTPKNISAGMPLQVTVTVNNFPLVMPFIGAILGRQSIDLSTTIKGSLIGPPYP